MSHNGGGIKRSRKASDNLSPENTAETGAEAPILLVFGFFL
jgi:hypothetical protein